MNHFLPADRGLRVRLMLAGAALFLAASMFLPLWSTEMISPQYHGEDAIIVKVYPGTVAGSLREVQTLNQYIGARLPLDAPELHAMPWVLGVLLLLATITVFLPERLRYKAIVANFALMIVGGAAGAVMLQYRLYQIGHQRTHAILRGIPNFTPPIVGSLHLANFQIDTGLMAGGWSLAVAVALTGLAVYFSRRPAPDWVAVPCVRHAQVSR